MTIHTARLATPVGTIVVAVRDGRLCALEFSERWPHRRAALERRFGEVEFRGARDPAGVVSRLRRYFGGSLAALEGIRVDTGGTTFQQRVWRALRAIRPGRTVSYTELARAVGAPRAARAVGAANGANPVGIVIPCHRVVAAGGGLGGYAGGVARKRWLLVHERAGRSTRPTTACPLPAVRLDRHAQRR
jgi:methylated-DNA-[protein]-cysteine S-methyltransferase